MKRCLFIALIVTMSGLSAQDTGDSQEVGSSPEMDEMDANQTVGYAAASSAEAPKKSDWQNWVFAGSALLTVAAGVVIISLNSGTNKH